MIGATAILRKEHDAILEMLALAEETAALLERDEAVPADILDELLEFFRLFACLPLYLRIVSCYE